MIWRKKLISVREHIKEKVVNNIHHQDKISTFIFLFSVMMLSVLAISLSVSTLAVNAQQPYSPSPSSVFGANSNDTGDTAGVTKMGICEVGAGGPCNNVR